MTIIRSREDLEALQASGELTMGDADEVRAFMDFLAECGPYPGKPGANRRQFLTAYIKHFPDNPDIAEFKAALEKLEAKDAASD